MLIARVILLAVFLPITLILTIVATPLANLTLDRRIFPELLQDAASPEAIFRELEKILLDGETAARMKAGYEELKLALGGEGASARTAKDMYDETARI